MSGSDPSARPRWLITGASGLLGPYLTDACSGVAEVITTSRSDTSYPCDHTDPVAVANLMAEVEPDVVVNAAAMTDVDGCERDEAKAMALNALVFL